jgi:hypothetical protein
MTASQFVDEKDNAHGVAIALSVFNVVLVAVNAYAALVVLPVAGNLTSWGGALLLIGGPFAVATLVLAIIRARSPLRLVLVLTNIVVAAAYAFFWGLFFLGGG